jgi:hypothetical protein
MTYLHPDVRLIGINQKFDTNGINVSSQYKEEELSID